MLTSFSSRRKTQTSAGRNTRQETKVQSPQIICLCQKKFQKRQRTNLNRNDNKENYENTTSWQESLSVIDNAILRGNQQSKRNII
jgi:hypothetical protein